MSLVKIFAVVPVMALVLSGCTVTSSQVKSTSAGAQGKPGQVASVSATRLSDVYERSVAARPLDKTLRKIYSDSIPDGKQIRVRMMPEFGREFLLCDASDKCEQVLPISQPDKTYTGEEGKVDDSLIGDVLMSEQTGSLFGQQLPAIAAGKRIVLMEPDIELSLLTAGGLQEPNALWTSAAKGYVTELSAQYFQKLGHAVTVYSDTANGLDAKTGQDLINLHEAVGQSIFIYQYPGLLQLPTKETGAFNWKLGKTTKQLKQAYGADLGLFIYMRDSYSSGSRVAAQFLMAALFGAHIPGGQQVGFVSLVDMETGDIVWFNRLHSTTGDLRTFGAALNATDALLKDIPL